MKSVLQALAAMLLLPAASTSLASAPCSVVAPAEFKRSQIQWLGDCRGGLAEGKGIIRAGSAEPYQFFAGEIHAGRPVRGLLLIGDDWFAAAGFDPDGHRQDIRSGDPNEYHALFVVAAGAAETAARHFAAAGNRSSAAYYHRLAKKIVSGEPE